MPDEREIEKFQRKVEEKEKVSFSSAFDLKTLLSRELGEPSWIVNRFIPANGLTLLSGAPGQYKSWIALHIACSVSQQFPVFNQLKCEQARGVMVVDEENSERRIQSRIKLLNENQDALIYFHVGERLVLEEKETCDFLLEEAKKLNVELIIFDSFVRFFPRYDENSSKDMNLAYQRIKPFLNEKIAILFTHHNRKQGILKIKPTDTLSLSEAMRGSSDILAMADCHIAVMPVKRGEIAIAQTKQRDDEILDPFKVQIVNEENKVLLRWIGDFDEDENKAEKCMEAVLETLNHSVDGCDREYLEELYKGTFSRTYIVVALRELEKLGRIEGKTKKDLGLEVSGHELKKKLYFAMKMDV